MVGMMIGTMHATAFWHAAQRPSRGMAIVGVARLLAVIMVLTSAAGWGGILATAAGWAMGFVVGVVVVLSRIAWCCHKSVACVGGKASAVAPSESGKA
jgi:hypothetical protein